MRRLSAEAASKRVVGEKRIARHVFGIAPRRERPTRAEVPVRICCGRRNDTHASNHRALESGGPARAARIVKCKH